MKTGCNVDLEFGPEIGQEIQSPVETGIAWSKFLNSTFSPILLNNPTNQNSSSKGAEKGESKFLSWPFLTIPVAFLLAKYDIMAFETDKYHLIQR